MSSQIHGTHTHKVVHIRARLTSFLCISDLNGQINGDCCLALAAIVGAYRPAYNLMRSIVVAPLFCRFLVRLQHICYWQCYCFYVNCVCAWAYVGCCGHCLQRQRRNISGISHRVANAMELDGEEPSSGTTAPPIEIRSNAIGERECANHRPRKRTHAVA